MSGIDEILDCFRRILASESEPIGCIAFGSVKVCSGRDDQCQGFAAGRTDS
jgi:hypothetical protein